MSRTILEIAPGALTDYYDWIKGAAAGDVLVYWIGDLQHDRSIVIPENDVLRGADRLRITTLNVVADRVFEDAKDGHLLLTQKRLGACLFEYRATRKRPTFGQNSDAQPNDQLVLA